VALPRLSRGSWFALPLLALAALLAAACGSQKVYREGTPAIVGRPGDFAVIELAADPTTGYSWMLVGHADPRIVTLIDNDYEPSKSPASGVPGHQRWRFRFVGPGTATLTFGFGRTWANAPAEKATTFNVTVR
jgi:predicted secreted protein